MPVYLLAILRTFSSGLMATASANHLILERGYVAWIGSVISALFFFGFLIFTLAFGSLSDRIGQAQTIRFTFIASMITGALSLIPISNTLTLASFGIWRFIDGGFNGLFWPTVQQYTVVAQKFGDKERDKYLSGYNFSWNLGFLLSMGIGTILLYIIDSNYFLFYVNFLLAIVGMVIAYAWLTQVPLDNKSTFNPPPQEQYTNVSIQDKQSDRLDSLPFYLIIVVIFAHALTDGALVINLPLKVELLSLPSFWVFALGFGKALSQIIANTMLSNVHESKIIRGVYFGMFSLAIIWFLFLFIPNIWIIMLLLICSGIVQGTVYALGMKLMSFKAQAAQSARPYSLFQATMGCGRMAGQITIGTAALVSPMFGNYFLVGYDIFVLTHFWQKTKQLNIVYEK